MTIKKGFKVEKPRAFDPREQSGVDHGVGSSDHVSF